MAEKTAWDCMTLIREKNRPTINDYIPLIFSEFYELHGDRHYGDDGAVLGGIGRLEGMPVTVIAEVKGRDLISQCLIRKDTERLSGSLSRQKSFTVPLSALLILQALSAELKPKKEVREKLSLKTLWSL